MRIKATANGLQTTEPQVIATINDKAPTNTKAIARKTGLTTAQVNETARDLCIEMTYRSDLRYWEVVNRAQASAFLEHLLEAN